MSAETDDRPVARPAFWRRWTVAAALGFGLWWLGSILLHALLFGVLYIAGPKQALAPGSASEDFHMTMSPEHVAAVVADIREQQKEEFAKKIEELASVKAQLDALDARKVEEYNALMREEARQAPEIARQAAADARAGQQEALAAQAAAQAAIAAMNEAQARAAQARDDASRAAARQELKNSTQAAQEAQAAASQAQKKAIAAQTKLTQQTTLFSDGKPAQQAAADAAAAQAEAERQQDNAALTRQQWEQDQPKIGQHAAEVQRFQAAAEAAGQKVADAEKRLAELQPPPPATPAPAPASPAAESPSTPATSAAPAPASSGGGEAVGQSAPPVAAAPPAASSATPLPTPTRQVKQEIDRLTRTLPQAKDAQAKAAAREADARQKLAAAQENAARQLQKLRGDEDQARQKQQAAAEAQAKAEQTVLAALDKAGTAPAAATAAPAPPPAAPPNANLADLFHQAQQMEAAVAESYKNVRAAELAAIREIPLAQAAALTEVAKPVRAEIDTGILTRDIRDVPGVRAQEKAIEAAAEQMNSMVALAQRMRDLAQPEQTTVSVAAMKAASGHTEAMERLAAEDEGTTAKDLTAAMQGTGGPGGKHHHGHGGGDDGKLAAQATADLATAAAQVAANPADVGARLEYERALAAWQAMANAQGADGGAAQGVAGSGGADGGGADGPMGKSRVPDVPYLDARHFKPIPGRTITPSMIAQPADRERQWMFVDSWYMIGPWPNPGRKNLDTKFQPESVVDLDATYTGGRRDEAPLPVRWQFYQASAVEKNPGSEATGMITPPGLSEFEIYYAYTELWLDEAADLWVAIGSDDQSKVWLNGQMIWKSADYYKPWVANEGLRKVHFDKGINRVLLRLENGHLSGCFSFMVCLDPTAPPPAQAKRAGQR